MNPRAYFLVNDTRYDNHHGGLTVVRNLHLAMSRRGWTCTGSLPVSSSARHLPRHFRAIEQASLIVVNGEGSLHHESRNTRRLFDICTELAQTHPVALVNAVWQDNDAVRWKPLLERMALVQTRDRRSQDQLRAMGIAAKYAPDLTFYEYPRFPGIERPRFGCTDSVLKSWTARALELCRKDSNIDFLTLFTRDLRFRRGPRDWAKALKYRLYPGLNRLLGIPVPPRYRSLLHAENDTAAFLHRLASCRALCAARYHALCFALQQNVPCIAVASNSHKIESLLEDAGLTVADHVIDPAECDRLKERLDQAVARHPAVETRIAEFNRTARERIDAVFDRLAAIP
jgi:hypothetical protein